jgi:hypothetical protein
MVVQRDVRITRVCHAPFERGEHGLQLRGRVGVKFPRRQVENDAVVIQQRAVGDDVAGPLPALVQRYPPTSWSFRNTPMMR